MFVVVALGGNALLRRHQPLTAENQRANVKVAAKAIARLISAGHHVAICHGNGPQVGLLALQTLAYHPNEAYPLDILGAESEGMIGYLIEQELANILSGNRQLATLLSQVEVDADDPAFANPTKPIGPIYSPDDARRIGTQHSWKMKPDGEGFRRVVPSPLPKRILEIDVIRSLVRQNVIVISMGGGGIPVVRDATGQLIGVEAVIDKDRAAALLASELRADALLLLTDVEGIYQDWGTPQQQVIRAADPADLSAAAFPSGSMGPKVEAASEFAAHGGTFAGIGKLTDALDILEGRVGTLVRRH